MSAPTFAKAALEPRAHEAASARQRMDGVIGVRVAMPRPGPGANLSRLSVLDRHQAARAALHRPAGHEHGMGALIRPRGGDRYRGFRDVHPEIVSLVGEMKIQALPFPAEPRIASRP